MKRKKSILIQIISGVLLALAIFFILCFFSPPLPFYDESCGTSYNSKEALGISLFILWIWFSIKYLLKKKEESPNEGAARVGVPPPQS